MEELEGIVEGKHDQNILDQNILINFKNRLIKNSTEKNILKITKEKLKSQIIEKD